MRKNNLDDFILTSMPHFITVNYRLMLEAQTPQERVKLALHIYDLGLRALTITLVSQYLIQVDEKRVEFPELNELLQRKFHRMTLDAWQQMLFAALRAYRGKQSLFFMPELYDFYWDVSVLPHRKRAELNQPFDRLTQITMESRQKQYLPQTESEWKNLEEETINLLRQILRSMDFLAKYDLIRVVENDKEFKFELHKGPKISTECQPLIEDTELSPGQFYLRKREKDFLPLHPLLVFWEEKSNSNQLMQTDTGVYERYFEDHTMLQYLLTVLGELVQEDRNASVFAAFLYDTLAELGHKRQEAERLTWWQLRDTCASITQNRMATVRDKYQSELYLQRNKTSQEFNGFLQSEKRGFILIGKSGVGKSNFLLAMREEQKSNNDVCMLMYDGAHLRVEPSITETISKDFGDQLVLAGRQIQHVWRDIAQIEGIKERLVILCVDAINENPQARELLQQLDELLEKPWPWLKIVFSSRPEAWKVIKQRVKLTAAQYYREDKSQTLGIELEPFSYSEQMYPFTRHELPMVYAKYQQKFGIQTQYEDLPPQLRKAIQDPLSLWLVAKTFEEQSIPDTLKVTELVEGYVKDLLQNARLQTQDLRFLEKRLVPLMTKKGHYSNVITNVDIDTADLYDAIYSEQMLSDGRRMNQSFTNLLDADILVRYEEGREQEITFKYERFYEYFVGKYLLQEYKKSADEIRFLKELAASLSQVPFLWGVLCNLLADLLKEGKYVLIEELGETTDILQCQLIISVLTEHYPQHQTMLQPILLKWLASQNTLAAQIAANVAIDCQIEQVLCNILVHPSERVRSLVVQDIHRLWSNNSDLTIKILAHLSRQIRFTKYRDLLEHIDTLFRCSILLIIYDYSILGANLGARTETAQIVQNIWRPVIRRLLFVSQHGFTERITRRIRRGVLRLLSQRAANMIQSMEGAGVQNVFNYKDFIAFFPADVHQKAIFDRLVPHIDAATGQFSESVEDLAIYIKELMSSNTPVLTIGLALLALVCHVFHDPLGTANVLRELDEELQNLFPPSVSSQKLKPGFWSRVIVLPFGNLRYTTEMSRELSRQVLEIFIEIIYQHEIRYRSTWHYDSGYQRVNMIGEVIWGYALDLPELGSETLERFLTLLIERDDFEQIKQSPIAIANRVSNYRLPDAGVAAIYDTLSLLKDYLGQLDKDRRAEFWDYFAENTVLYMSNYREQLIYLAEVCEEDILPQMVKVRLLNPSQSENLGYILQQSISWFMSDGLKDENPFVRDLFKLVFNAALEVDSFQSGMLELLCYAGNLIYGDVIFATKVGTDKL